jgi:hypothetical protein
MVFPAISIGARTPRTLTLLGMVHFLLRALLYRGPGIHLSLERGNVGETIAARAGYKFAQPPLAQNAVHIFPCYAGYRCKIGLADPLVEYHMPLAGRLSDTFRQLEKCARHATPYGQESCGRQVFIHLPQSGGQDDGVRAHARCPAGPRRMSRGR